MSDTSVDEDYVCGCDEDIEDPLCIPCTYDQSYLIRKICALFNDNYAGTIIHRHIILLNEYLRAATDGIRCEDVRFVAYLLELLARGGRPVGGGAHTASKGPTPEDSAESGADAVGGAGAGGRRAAGGGAGLDPVREPTLTALRYETPLRHLLALCARPPLQAQPKHAVDDAIHEDLQELFNALGFVLVTVEDEDLALRAVNAVYVLLTRKDCVLAPAPPGQVMAPAAEDAPPAPRCCGKRDPSLSPTRQREPRASCPGSLRPPGAQCAACDRIPYVMPHQPVAGAQPEAEDNAAKCPVPLQWRVAAAERSALATTVATFMEFASPGLYCALVDLGLLLASISMKCCSDLVQGGALDMIFLRLSPEYPLLPLEALAAEEEQEAVAGAGRQNELHASQSPLPTCRDPCIPTVLEADEAALVWGCLRAMQVLGTPPPPARPSNMAACPLLPPPTKWPAPSHRALKCLSNCLHGALINCDVPAANSILSIVLMLQHLFPELEMVESGLAEDVATLAVSSELNEKEDWTEAVNSEKSREVFELKRVLLLSVSYLARLPNAKEVLRKRRVAYGLTQLVCPGGAGKTGASLWRPALARALQSLSLHALTAIALHAPQEVVQAGALTHLLLCIEAFTADAHRERGDGAVPIGGEAASPEDIKQMLVIVFHLAGAPGERCFREQVIKEGATDTLMRLCSRLLQRGAGGRLGFNEQGLLRTAFLALEELCRKREGVEEATRHGRAAVALSRDLLLFALSSTDAALASATTTHPHNDQPALPTDDKMLICGISFIWRSVVNNAKNSEMFVKDGLVYKLLDLLQASSLPVQTLLLGLLVDLLEFGRCLPLCITWRGKTDPEKGFLSMLLEIWRQEERFIKASRDSTGCITDITLPMMGEEMRECVFAEEKDPQSSPAIVDMYLSARPKIYAIIQLIKHRYKDMTEIIEEMYHIYNELTPQDELTMLLAQNYLPLKLKEVWSEIILDVGRRGITPIPSDFNMMNVLNNRFIERTQEILQSQDNVIHGVHKKELQNEGEFYRSLEGSAAMEQMDTLRELEAFACVSDPQFLKKMKKEEEEKRVFSAALPAPPHLEHTDCVDPLFRLLLYQNCNMRYRRDFGEGNS